jgi:predicted RNA binding protein YcfA (HicA-like mRNA interferase family)
MSKPQKYRDVIKFLKAQGWVFIREAKGSHEIWGNPNQPTEFLSLPNHKEVSAGIIGQLRKIFPNTPQNWK